MKIVHIPDVGAVHFPDEMPMEEMQKHSAHLHSLHQIGSRTGSIDVTRSIPYAKRLAAKSDTPAEIKHFVNSAEKQPNGQWHSNFSTARHAAMAARFGNKSNLPIRSEFVRMLSKDLHEGTEKAGTKDDWLTAERELQPARR